MHERDSRLAAPGNVSRVVAETRELPLMGWTVSRVCVDHQFSLVFEAPDPRTGTPNAHLTIGTAFVYRDASGVAHAATPGPPQVDVAPALAVHTDLVVRATASAEGVLELEFESGGRITVPADPNYEAWLVTGPAGLVVCGPGGGEPTAFRG